MPHNARVSLSGTGLEAAQRRAIENAAVVFEHLFDFTGKWGSSLRNKYGPQLLWLSRQSGGMDMQVRMLGISPYYFIQRYLANSMSVFEREAPVGGTESLSFGLSYIGNFDV